MLLNKTIQIMVFKLDNQGTFDSIGEINQFTSLLWPDKFNGYATFELWAPITEENAEYLKKGNILWCGGDNAAMVEIVKSQIDDDGNETYHAKGRTLEMLLTTRIVWGTYNAVAKQASTIMYELVSQHCINPTNERRKIPFLELAEDNHFGGAITMQKTGGEVYDVLTEIASNADIGFNVLFRPAERKLVFEVVEGVDRTIVNQALGQTKNSLVEFNTDLEDIQTSSYYTNDQDMKNIALVMGEGSGVERKSQISGDSDALGFERRELYVDARDLQSNVSNEDGTTSSLTTEEYNETLINRGNNKLSEHKVTETFEAKLRVFGDVQYEFGVDYDKGDKVIVRDKKLGVVVTARITEVEESFDDEYGLELTFGYSYPTIMQRIKQQMT